MFDSFQIQTEKKIIFLNKIKALVISLTNNEMEYLIGLGIIYLIGNKALNNDKLTAAGLNNKTPYEPFDEYTRDDYASTRQLFPDNETDQQLISEGVILGDSEYFEGYADPEKELSSFDPLSWYNTPNLPSVSVSPNYLI